jgi:cytochrome bd ubiquinol oxidase subunit I
VAFGLGVVSGVVMAFQFGTNWSVLSKMSGPIQGPLISYETFAAFALEASFFGVLLFGRSRVPPVVLSVLDRDGGARHYTFGVLDHGQ